ncbi:MAG TPA: MlaD family protein [Polyangiaceae bacterium]|nr:MlaD family protein [Polyangiaceae bacterium]
MNQRSIEVKVGALILVALGLLGAFVVIMGGLSFEPSFTVYVGFQNPGGLQAGAPVRISGVKVGRVSSIEFRGGKLDPSSKKPESIIRAVAKIERRYQEAIRENSRWFVTSQGVLGEMFLAVEPGTYDRPILADGANVQGISPPRLDLLLSESYELLHRAYLGITNNEQQLAETFEGLHRTLKASGDLLERNGPKLDRTLDNVEQLSSSARDAVSAARERYVDNPQITRILNDVERSSGALARNLEPTLTDGRDALQSGKKFLTWLSQDTQLQRLDATTRDLAAAAQHAKQVGAEAEALVRHVQQGKGTLGALAKDEAIYDDIQELLRDLKHNPWKFFWRQ